MHVILHVGAILPSSGAMRSLVATMTFTCVCDVAQSSDVLCVADTCRDVDIAEGVLFVETASLCHDMLRCACVLRLRVLECVVTTTLLLVSMISVSFLLRSYYFTEHVALNGCNVIVLSTAIIPRTMPCVFVFFGCSCSCLCLNNVVTITHCMVFFLL